MLCVICAFLHIWDIGAWMLVDMYDLYFMYCTYYVVPSKQFHLPICLLSLFAGRQPFSIYQGNGSGYSVCIISL